MLFASSFLDFIKFAPFAFIIELCLFPQFTKMSQWFRTGLLESKVPSKIITKILFKANIENTNKEQIHSKKLECDSVYDEISKYRM